MADFTDSLVLGHQEEQFACGEFPKWSILLGAGFSANWGAPVAQQIWAHLISDPEVQAHDEARSALLDDRWEFNFEEVLYRAQTGMTGASALDALQSAIYRAYQLVETTLILGCRKVNRTGINQILNQVRSFDEYRTGAIFTLNQDMLLERLFTLGLADKADQRPCVTKPRHPNAVLGEGLNKHDCTAPDELVSVSALRDEPPEGWPNLTGTTGYFKLHGSWDWTHPDGERAMVLGGNKREAIARYPLLRFYHSVFRRFLNSGDRRLLVIGYGFADQHINEMLCLAA